MRGKGKTENKGTLFNCLIHKGAGGDRQFMEGIRIIFHDLYRFNDNGKKEKRKDNFEF